MSRQIIKVMEKKKQVHAKQPDIFMKHPFRLGARLCSRTWRPSTDRTQSLPWWGPQAWRQVTFSEKTKEQDNFSSMCS